MGVEPAIAESVCGFCQQKFIHRVGEPRRFCSPECRRAEKALQQSVKLSSGSAGAVNELIVSADLLRRGYHIFRAISPSCPCDLVLLHGGRCWRVEVTTAYENMDGRIVVTKHKPDRYDIIAGVLPDGTIHYSSLP
jgi:hypothetical protein